MEVRKKNRKEKKNDLQKDFVKMREKIKYIAVDRRLRLRATTHMRVRVALSTRQLARGCRS